MRKLFTIDLKDYDERHPRSKRTSARAIIIKNNLLAMVYSEKYKYYEFPGGGLEEGEEPKSAVVREVREETGLVVIPDSIKEYGLAETLRKSEIFADAVFWHENLYYLCDVANDKDCPSLEDYEIEAGFTLHYVTVDEAIRVNTENTISDNRCMLMRESRVLEMLKGEFDL